MNTEHDSTFVINDIQLTIPPEQISIQRQSLNRQWNGLRQKATMKAKSGHSTIVVQLSIPFIGIDEINSRLRPLLAQFKLTPFCYVENEHLRNVILGSDYKSTMALALQNITVNTVQDAPDTLLANLQFLWFNYKPFTPSFSFKDHPLIPLSQEVPGRAWKLFYLPQLEKHPTITTVDGQSVVFSYPEFTIDQSVIKGKTPSDFALQDVIGDSQRQKLDVLIGEYTNITNLLHTSLETREVDQTLIHPDALNGLDLAVSKFNQAFVQQGATAEAAREFANSISNITSKFSQQFDQQAQFTAELRALLGLKDQINRTVVDAISKPGGWLPVFKDPIVDSTMEPTTGTSMQPKAYQVYTRQNAISANNGFGEDIIVTGMQTGFAHHLVPLPIASFQYPTCQYLGSSDTYVNLSIKVMSDVALAALTDMHTVLSNNSLDGRFVPQQFTNLEIYNQIVQMMGGKEMIIDSFNVDTIPGSPGTYDVSMSFVEAGPKPGDLEKLQVDKVSDNQVRNAIWNSILSKVFPVSERTERVINTGPASGNGSEPLVKLRFLPLVDELEDGTRGEEQFINTLLDNDISATNTPFIVNTDGSGGLSDKLLTLYASIFDVNKGHFSSSRVDNMLRAFGVTNEEVLGADALTSLMYQIIVADGGSSPVDTFFGGESFANVRSVALEQSGGDTSRAKNDLELLRRANEVYEQILVLNKNLGTRIDRDGNFINENGELVSLQQYLRSEDLPRVDLNRATRQSVRGNQQVLATFSDPDTHAHTLYMSILDEYRAELIRLQSSPTSTRERAAQELYKDWNIFAVRVADFIVSAGLLDLPLFEEARRLHDGMIGTRSKQAYPDFNLEDVDALIRTFYSAAKIPLDFVLEPDFYFYNETADLAPGNLLSPEQIQHARDYARKYAFNTLAHGTTYFNTEYMRKLDPKFQDFVRNSVKAANRGKQVIGPIGGNTQAVIPQASQVNNDPVTAEFFGSNETKIGGKSVDGRSLLSGFVQSDERKDGLSKPIHTLSHTYDIEQVVAGSTQYVSLTAEELDAYGVWVNPLPGGVITSGGPPGDRNVEGGSKFHKGTDLAHPNGSQGKIVIAAHGGEVIKAEVNHPVNGNWVKIRSNFGGAVFIHNYLHLDTIASKFLNGGQIKTGEYLGSCGNTGRSFGAHLHFEVFSNRYPGIPVFPFADQGDARPGTIGVPLIRMHTETSLPVGPVASHTQGESILDKSIASLLATHNRNSCYRMNRAYPTFHLRFIEDDSEEDIYSFDDFISYNSLVSIEAVKDREVAADLAVVTLTNISGVLSNRKWKGTYNEGDPRNAQGRVVKENPENPLLKDTQYENPIASMMLQEGTKVELRMGYTNNVDKMDIVIIGKIMEIGFSDTDDLVQIVVQSLATELTQEMKAVDSPNEEGGTWIMNQARTSKLLINMISQPECVSFGMWKRTNPVTNSYRDMLTDRWEWNPKPQTDNIFAPDSRDIDPARYDSGILGLAPGAINSWLEETNYFLFRTTVWDVFKEMELRHPDYIASPVPYVEKDGRRTRMTMFFGLPDQLYFARDPSTKETSRHAELEQIKIQSDIAANDLNFEKLDKLVDQLSIGDEAGADKLRQLIKIGKIGTERGLRGHTFTELGEGVVKAIEHYTDIQQKKDALDSGAIQPFRKYHILTSRQHIISNNITASVTNTFNAVTVQYRTDNDQEADDLAGDSDFHENEELGIDRDGLILLDPETLTMKLDPRIPDEDVRENLVSYPNCLGEEMAKRYAVALLTQGCKYMYKGDLVILGNPGIKPYDICFVFDEYSDMVGPIEVRRVCHYFDKDNGFITVITPDCVARAGEGTTMFSEQAMALMAEAILRREFGWDTNFSGVGQKPNKGVIDSISQDASLGGLARTIGGVGSSIGSFLAYQTAGTVGELVGFFGLKKMIFINQFGHPVRLSPLLHNGRPMVAGVAPDKLECEFWINRAAEWVRVGFKGLTEGADEMWRRWTDPSAYGNRGITNSRGRANGGRTGFALTGNPEDEG